MIRSSGIRLLVWGAALAVLAFSRAWPQQMQPSGDISMHIVHRKMMMTGDFTAKVQLGSAMAKHPTVGVGAVADARGEISIFDGRLVVSYGKGGKPADASSEYAALLVL